MLDSTDLKYFLIDIVRYNRLRTIREYIGITCVVKMQESTVLL